MSGIIKNFVLFVFALFLMVSPIKSQTQADLNQLSRASQLQPRDRVPILHELLKKNPDWIVAKYALGVAYYSLNEYELVIPLFSDVLKSGEKFDAVDIADYLAAAHYEVAKKKMSVKQYSQAIDDLKEAIKYAPKTGHYFYNLGICYYHVANYDMAETVMQRAVNLYANNRGDQVRAYFYLGHIYNAKSEFDAALSAYKKTASLNPNLKSVEKYIHRVETELEIERLYKKAKTFIETGNPGDAIALLQQVIEYDPNHLEAKKYIEDAEREVKYQQAVNMFRRNAYNEAERLFTTLPSNYKDVHTIMRRIDSQQKADQQKRIVEQNAPSRSKPTNTEITDPITAAREKHQAETADSIVEEPVEEMPQGQLIADKDAVVLTNQPDVDQSFPPAESGMKEKQNPLQNEKNLQNSTTDEGSDISVWPFVIVGMVLLAAAAWFFILKDQNSGEKPDFTITEEEMRAIENRIDGTQHAQNNPTQSTNSRVGITPKWPTKSEPEASVIDIVEKEDSTEKDQTDSDDAQVFSTNFSAQDEEDFLKLVGDDNSGANFHGDTGKDTTIESDITQTIDMSQFRVQKIGRYIVEKEIGRGAAGRVYKAWDPKLDRTVVIKTVAYSLTATAEEIKRLKARVYREARAAAKLSHPNIVIVYDVEDETSFSYIVMEYIQGTDLRIMLEKEKQLKPETAIKFIRQTCKALHFAHSAGVVHRDVKPSNIMIVENDKVKVTDFGIAKVTNNLTLTQTGRVVGTPSYMAPEQIEGNDVDGRADVFSLGVVLYELLTGQRPFTGETIASLAYKLVHSDPPPVSKLNAHLPPEFDDIIFRAIAKKPDDRYKTTIQFEKALSKVQAGIISK